MDDKSDVQVAVERARMFDAIDRAYLEGIINADHRGLTSEIDALHWQLRLGLLLGLVWLGGLTVVIAIAISHLPGGG